MVQNIGYVGAQSEIINNTGGGGASRVKFGNAVIGTNQAPDVHSFTMPEVKISRFNESKNI